MVLESEPLTILHFNDVYNVEPRKTEPVGGAARFCTAFKTYKDRNPLVLFSGDIFAPSIMSTFTQGEQMIPVLDSLGVHCSVYGNHEFDFGLDILLDLVEKTTFPWLMSNVMDNETGRPLADGKVTHVIEWAGKKIGLMGLVEREWLDTLSTINPDEVTFEDFVDCGRRLCQQLRDEKCDLIIALTHMRTPNDVRLAEQVDDIDLILGGHDHVYEIHKVNGIYILKSGTDFRQFSVVTVTFPIGRLEVEIERVDVTSKFEEDEELCKTLGTFSYMLEDRLDDVLGTFSVPLDGQFSSIRTGETNLGNFVCDVMVASTQSDVALLNSGTLRSDRVHPAGPFTLRDLLHVLPMLDHMIVLKATGRQLLQALENSVSQYPRLEGRFPQVSGVSFAFDPEADVGSRVNPRLVKVGDSYLDMDVEYRLVTKSYLQSGRDGYDVLTQCPVLVGAEACPELCTAIQNHFHSVKMYRGLTRHNSRHRQSLVTLSRRHSLLRSLDFPPTFERQLSVSPNTSDGLAAAPKTTPSGSPHATPIGPSKAAPSILPIASVLPPSVLPCSPVQVIPKPSGGGEEKARPRLSRQASLDDLERETARLAPVVEGRIMRLTLQVRERLLKERAQWEMDQVIEETEEPESPVHK